MQQALPQRSRALQLLKAVRSAGLSDPFVEVALCVCTSTWGWGRDSNWPTARVSQPGLAGQERAPAPRFRADALVGESRHAEAAATLRRLTVLRRHSMDWLLLADCEQAPGHTDAWADALSMAARINPGLVRVHQTLADYCDRRGDPAKAAWHRRRAVP